MLLGTVIWLNNPQSATCWSVLPTPSPSLSLPCGYQVFLLKHLSSPLLCLLPRTPAHFHPWACETQVAHFSWSHWSTHGLRSLPHTASSNLATFPLVSLSTWFWLLAPRACITECGFSIYWPVSLQSLGPVLSIFVPCASDPNVWCTVGTKLMFLDLH